MRRGATLKRVKNAAKLIWFCFVYDHTRSDRDRPFPGSRDPNPFIEIQSALADQGIRYAHTIFNYPREDGAPPLPPGCNLDGRCVIAVVTRPPINETDAARKGILTSGSWIESLILGACSEYFAVSRRNSIVLTDRVQRAVGSMEIEGKASEVKVYTWARATYRDPFRNGPAPDADKSPVYLLRLPSIDWNGKPGPDLLVAFGMSATLSYAWAYHLRTRKPELLTGYRFVMAEFTLPETLNLTPAHPEELCGDWQLDIIFDLPVPVADTLVMKETTRAGSGDGRSSRQSRQRVR
jgi:hypothetical protein